MTEYCSFEVYPGVNIKIKPWTCKWCSTNNISHPYYCKVCNSTDNGYSVVAEAENRKNINKIEKVNKVFGKDSKILLPVLSCHSYEQFLINIDNIYKYYQNKKISGIFILSTNVDKKVLYNVYTEAKSRYPDFWIGVNLIGENIFTVLKFIKNYNPDGVWVDNSYLYDINRLGIANLILNEFEKYEWDGLYFGGYMFKYQQGCNEYNLDLIKIVHQYTDILTTSGDGTGIEISSEKINFIHENVKDKLSVGVASGITSSNINSIIDKCNIFIVRTSIVDEQNNIDCEKLSELCEVINSS